ncbi:MAG TPA: hypothetical protein VE172_09235 [Stackebrandtia sp.]|jgi:hypothetical protein|uniref:hypothetical protein n=1 Tax=Stackebrandtia sp. TaxID=2023065 RepID=UPI002D36DC20|nr:hypothetical protein [Stackebrandtia sp.]HZE38980.1 hypothetical protein [Stackebrandtia sp.]
MSHGTAADLFYLWRFANVGLPRVAEVYFATSGMAESTHDTRGVFVTDASGEENLVSPVYTCFSRVRDEWQHILTKCATDIYDTADGLNQALDGGKAPVAD